MGPKLTPRVDAGVDSRMDAVSDDCAELTPAGVHHNPFDDRTDRGTIMTHVSRDRACTEIAFFSDDGVSNVTEMGNRGAVHQNRVFDFDALSYSASVSNRGTRA